MSDPKPGVRSSEFWVVLSGYLLLWLNERFGLEISDELTAAIAAALAAIYVVCRTALKAVLANRGDP